MSPADIASKYADKIAKLLEKAQSTTPEEAESLVSKAQELMTRYAIDQALVDEARGANSKEREEIIEAIVEYAGTFRMATWRLAHTIARKNGCTTVLNDDTRARITQLHIIGFETDVERVRILDASLQIQMASALNTWWKADDALGLLDRNSKFAARRQFMFSFTQGVSERLKVAVAAGETAATKEHGTSVALVLRSRKDRVQDWMDQEYGNTLRSVKRNYKSGTAGSHAAGYAAGQRADVGQPRFDKRKELGS
jgi:hypothetical protein